MLARSTRRGSNHQSCWLSARQSAAMRTASTPIAAGQKRAQEVGGELNTEQPHEADRHAARSQQICHL